MTTPAVERQIAMLRPTVGFAGSMHRWLLVGAALGALAAVTLWHPVPLMLAVFLGAVGLGERRAGPNIVSALAAFDAGTPTNGEVLVTIATWDSDHHYHATVREHGHPDWSYAFVPQGWRPAARSYPALIWRASGVARPVLAVVDEGILIPRGDPKQVSEEGRPSRA